ncbi:MAG: GNAT family N-acetyltransferase [Planctomycetes bacterium]|nr:GNAT family N-acetyltransferase [Planctomycetota bacterium]
MAWETERVRLDPRTIREGVLAVLADPAKGRYFVAERGGEAAGALLITYEWSDWRNGTFLWLQSVYVEPAHRRRGVFVALFGHLERLAAEPGCCGLRLYMDAHNEQARAAYERLGLRHRGYLVFESPDRLRAEGS